jgi:hypothetical protein
MQRYPIPLEAIKELRKRDPRRINRTPALHFRYQAGAFDLGLAFDASEGMPAALAFARDRIAGLQDDCIMTR